MTKPNVGHLIVFQLFWTLSRFANFQCTLLKHYCPEAHKPLYLTSVKRTEKGYNSKHFLHREHVTAFYQMYFKCNYVEYMKSLILNCSVIE